MFLKGGSRHYFFQRQFYFSAIHLNHGYNVQDIDYCPCMPIGGVFS